MKMKSIGVYLFFIVSAFFLTVTPSFATKFDLIPPSGTLQRGQDITFTINIDTEGASVTSIQSGLTYDSTLLQYVSVTAGAAMNSVVADTTTYGTGKVLFTGSNTAGFNGTGVFATVVFTIIAQSSGSTEICTLWLPQPSPTPGATPTNAPYATPNPMCGSVCTSNTQCPSDMPCYIIAGQTSGYCRRAACPQITNCVCPAPTALPTTGNEDSKNTAILLASVFLVAAGGVFMISQKQKYSFPHTQTKKHESIHKSKKSS
jgi:hypothetical protein